MPDFLQAQTAASSHYVGVQVTMSFAVRFRSVFKAGLMAKSLSLETQSFFVVRWFVLIFVLRLQMRRLRTVRMISMLALFMSDSRGLVNISMKLTDAFGI